MNRRRESCSCSTTSSIREKPGLRCRPLPPGYCRQWVTIQRIGIRGFSGEVEFDLDAMEAKDSPDHPVRVARVLDDISERDRREMDKMMKGDVLEVSKFPQIKFEATLISITRLGDALYRPTVSGNLSFHGVTRSQSVPVRITSLGEMIRASGDFTLKQSDYKIKPVSVAGGALKLKDELRFSFEMVAQRQEPAA